MQLLRSHPQPPSLPLFIVYMRDQAKLGAGYRSGVGLQPGYPQPENMRDTGILDFLLGLEIQVSIVGLIEGLAVSQP